MNLSWISHIATANDTTVLPAPLLDRFRIVKMPAPGAEHLPALVPQILAEIARERGVESFVEPFADDELDVMTRAWKRAGLSMRNLQKIVDATLDARDAIAVRH
jgi:ATP-dependent Lon protease